MFGLQRFNFLSIQHAAEGNVAQHTAEIDMVMAMMKMMMVATNMRIAECQYVPAGTTILP